MNAIVETKRVSLIDTMARGYGMGADIFAATVKKTCMPANASNEEFAAFLMVAHEHGLNPVTREIYAFPKKGGGIQPIVGIDGWMNLINSNPQFDGMQFDDSFDDKGNLTSITCSIYRKDRQHPTSVTEYMEECARSTEPWQKWPARMLRHKAAIQCARYAFGFAGIIDPEEAERSPDVETGEVMAPAPQIEETPEDTVEADEFDAAQFFEDLELAMAGASSEVEVDKAWAEFAPEITFEDDATNLEIAEKVKARRLNEIAAAAEPVSEETRKMAEGTRV